MTQDSRKAIIELLFLSLYTDDHLSLAEDGVLNEALDSLGWEGDEPRERFIFTAFADAREAHSEISKAQAFFTDRAAAIKSEGSEAEALTWLTKVLAADGFSPSEKYLLTRLEQFWYP
ncbi:MAG TPA: hypothetical protein VM511_00680 [Luteolibacter sp.]|jgi:hypothetical protein|nr:hypothetical protein [Luteolibacter sp.]